MSPAPRRARAAVPVAAAERDGRAEDQTAPARWQHVRALLEQAMSSDLAAVAARGQADAPGASPLAGAAADRLRLRADTDFDNAAAAAASYFKGRGTPDRAAALRRGLARLRDEQAGR